MKYILIISFAFLAFAVELAAEAPPDWGDLQIELNNDEGRIAVIGNEISIFLVQFQADNISIIGEKVDLHEALSFSLSAQVAEAIRDGPNKINSELFATRKFENKELILAIYQDYKRSLTHSKTHFRRARDSLSC